MEIGSFLSEIAPYVVVCGSFARGEEKLCSDIDCYVRMRPRDEYDPEDEDSDETYMPEILNVCRKNGIDFENVFFGYIAITNVFPRMIEISYHYSLPAKNKLFYREIYGAQMMCCLSDPECRSSEEWDSIADDGDYFLNEIPKYGEVLE